MAIREVTRTEHWLDPDPKTFGLGPVKLEWVGGTLQITGSSNSLWLDPAQQSDLFKLLRERHD